MHKRIYMIKHGKAGRVSFKQGIFCFPREHVAQALIDQGFAIDVGDDDRSIEEILKERDEEVQKQKEDQLKKDFPLVVFK